MFTIDQETDGKWNEIVTTLEGMEEKNHRKLMRIDEIIAIVPLRLILERDEDMEIRKYDIIWMNQEHFSNFLDSKVEF